jgi:hypothetical protein
MWRMKLTICAPLHETFTFVIKFVPLTFTIPWQGSCICHVFSEASQYAYNDTNVCKGFHDISLKAI